MDEKQIVGTTQTTGNWLLGFFLTIIGIAGSTLISIYYIQSDRMYYFLSSLAAYGLTIYGLYKITRSIIENMKSPVDKGYKIAIIIPKIIFGIFMLAVLLFWITISLFTLYSNIFN